MRKSRFNEEQIISVLREQESGATTAEVCRRHGISEQTFYRWKAKYGGMGPSDAQRLKSPRMLEVLSCDACNRRRARFAPKFAQ